MGLKEPLNDPEYADNPDYQDYLAFFEKVYETMEENYYVPVTRENYQKFLYMFNTKIYSQLKATGKSDNFIKWRSAAFLIDALKTQEDIFSAFFPPQPAKEYEQKVLGKKIDIGVEGEMIDAGYLVRQVQVRADTYEKGLREGDIILEINGRAVRELTKEELDDLLSPLEGQTVKLVYADHVDHQVKVIEPESKEYFKKFVFMLPVHVPDVYCVQIQKFNRMTAEDLTKYMMYVLSKGGTGLIIDLRGNPGGPPLAAREISAFFLPPDDEFAYFERRNKPKASLFVPRIPAPYHYKGDIVILVDKESGSASELFTGILQRRGRATVMGTNTAGQVFLKEMFNFDDESMLLLVTSRGCHTDGTVFSFSGLEPDLKSEGEDDLIRKAAEYLAEKRKGRALSVP